MYMQQTNLLPQPGLSLVVFILSPLPLGFLLEGFSWVLAEPSLRLLHLNPETDSNMEETNHVCRVHSTENLHHSLLN